MDLSPPPEGLSKEDLWAQYNGTYDQQFTTRYGASETHDPSFFPEQTAFREKAKTEFSKMKQEIAKRDHTLASLKSKTRTEFQKMKRELEDKDVTLRKLREDRTTADSKVGRSTQAVEDNNDADATTDVKRSLANDGVIASGEATQSIKNLEEEIERLRSSNARLQERVVEVKRASAETLRVNREKYEREMDDVEEKTSRARVFCEKLRKENKSYRTKVDALQKTSEEHRTRAQELERVVRDHESTIESLHEELNSAKEMNESYRLEDQMTREEMDAKLHASESAALKHRRKHLVSKQEAVKIAKNFERAKARIHQIDKTLKFVLIPRVRDMLSVVERLQTVSRDAIEIGKKQSDVDTRFAIEFDAASKRLDMELSNMSGRRGGLKRKDSNDSTVEEEVTSWDVLGQCIQTTNEELETLSDLTYKLIESKKEEADSRTGQDTRRCALFDCLWPSSSVRRRGGYEKVQPVSLSIQTRP